MDRLRFSKCFRSFKQYQGYKPTNRAVLPPSKIFWQEMNWAAHLSLSAVLLPPPSFNCVNYSQCVNQLLQKISRMSVWLRIPLVSPRVSAKSVALLLQFLS